MAPKLGDRYRSVKKVLLIRFSSIGDIVLTSPVIRVLRKELGAELELHYLLKAPFRDLLREDPRIDRLHTWEKGREKEVIAALKEENFDHVIDLQRSLRSLRLRALLGRPTSTFAKLNKEKWMLVNLKWNLLPRVHVVDRYFEALEPFGVENDGRGTELYLPPEEEVTPADIGLSKDELFLSFSIGGAHATKRLPEERILELCR
ncbi:MAG: glycosyltransferase family 9 protein, partial [Flavobacteriales bacterium]